MSREFWPPIALRLSRANVPVVELDFGTKECNSNVLLSYRLTGRIVVAVVVDLVDVEAGWCEERRGMHEDDVTASYVAIVQSSIRPVIRFGCNF